MINSSFFVIRCYNLVMKFALKSDKKESENKTIRFPVELITEIESVIIGKLGLATLLGLQLPVA